MTNDALPADAAPPAKSALHADTSPSSPLHADSAPSHQSIAHLPLPDPNRPRHTQASDTAPPTIPASAPDSATPSRPAVRAASESALDAQPPHPALDAESPSREALNDLLPEDLHDASLEEMLAWAVSVLADPPGLAPQPHEPPNPTPPDTS